VKIEMTSSLTERDRVDLRTFDSSFETRTIYSVMADGEGFTLVLNELATPLRKRYPIGDEIVGRGQPWDRAFLVREGDELIAFAATTLERWNNRQTLNELHVRHTHRRRGVARRLLDEVRHEAERNRAREIHVETQNVNHPGIQAYLRLGFRLTGIDLTRYPESREIALFLSAPVGSS
jgi:ribosomal protein S18 acetylase RimI-like enzyme